MVLCGPGLFSSHTHTHTLTLGTHTYTHILTLGTHTHTHIHTHTPCAQRVLILVRWRTWKT